MKIVVHPFPNVDQKFKERVWRILTQLYKGIRPPTAGIVDVYLFASFREMDHFLKREARSSGVNQVFSEIEFSSYHWAWGGWPCIAVCADIGQRKEVSVWTGEIEHESAHSILHGELEYYSFLPPQKFLNILKTKNFNQQLIDLLFYLVSVSIKDFEVTRLLVNHGFLANQIQMHLFHLQRSLEEKTIWKELHERVNPPTEVIATINDLKILASALPLLEHDSFIRDMVDSFLSIVTRRARKTLGSLLSSFEALGNDTHDNVETITNIVGEQVQDFLKPDI